MKAPGAGAFLIVSSVVHCVASNAGRHASEFCSLLRLIKNSVAEYSVSDVMLQPQELCTEEKAGSSRSATLLGYKGNILMIGVSHMQGSSAPAATACARA